MSVKINDLLKYAIEAKASDLHLSTGSIPMVRIDGVMQTLQLAVMTKDDMLKISNEILNDNQSKILSDNLEIDFSYELENFGRFRVNFFNQINGMAAAFRIIPSSILSSEELSIPPIINQLAFLDKGLVLLTGPTGSGKSTTLAAMINHINENKNKHIITVEDPVEYYHSSIKSLINQRELGHSTHSFANALKSALREDPDVILVGEMRDLETVSLALTAAETGHLVFGTLHTSGAPATINRIIDVFPPEQQEQIRAQISTSLKMVVTQRLLKTKDGAGRVGAFEVMKCTPPIQNLIREAKIHQIPSIMQTSVRDGMITMEKSLEELVKNGKIDQSAARSGH